VNLAVSESSLIKPVVDSPAGPRTLSLDESRSAETIRINISDREHADIECKVNPKMPISKFVNRFTQLVGECPDEMRVVTNRGRVNPEWTFIQAGLEDGDYIFVTQPQYGGKPVIYLWAPHEVEASVTLSLVKEWSFSAIYPVVPAKRLSTGGESIHWNVRTRSDGLLLESNTSLEVSYLYWEAT
jgi:hypothetical protein